MGGYNLTTGCLETIMAGQTVERPILQVLGQKKIAGTQGPDRYRLLLSDGIYTVSSAMLATQLNDKITSGELDNNSVIRLDKFICNPIQQDRRVMILLELSVLATGSEVEGKIGNPNPLRSGGAEHGSSNAQNQQEAKNQEPSSTTGPEFPANSFSSNLSNRSAVSSVFSSSTPITSQSNAPSRPAMPAANNNKVYNGGAPNFGFEPPANIHPIASLTPYQNRWTIRGRVTNKSNIRTWSNSRGDGKLFNIVLADESGEIRATAFTQEVEKFYNLIEVNKVYYVRKATLKTADKRYSSINNDYEMTFNSETEISPCEDNGEIAIPSMTFNFVPINQMEHHAANSIVDVIGVVKSVDDVRTMTSKQNKELKKRDIILVDESQVQIRLTLWGAEAEAFDGTGNPVVAIKGCRLSDWGGRSLSSLSSSQMVINPDIPEAHKLRGWYDEVGTNASYHEFKRDGESGVATGSGSGTNWKLLGDIKTSNLGAEKADFFTAKGTIMFLKRDNCMYMACPSADCNKKVVDNGNGTYKCEKCKQDHQSYKWRMILSVNVADFTDNHWVTCFQETAEQILGRKADEIGELKVSNEPEFDRLFGEANFKSFVFRMRAKMESFNDENRVKTVCLQASPVNCKEYNQKLLNEIDSMLGIR